MKKYLIPGGPLCETITGIPRYMFEVLTRMDVLMNGSCKFELAICYPEECNFIDYPFKNIKIISLNKEGKKWIPGTVIPYAKKQNYTLCDMADGPCLSHGQILKIDDVRPITQKYDSFFVRLKSKAYIFLAFINASTIITVSESQKRQLKKLLPGKDIRIFPNGYSQLQRFNSDEGVFWRNPKIEKNRYYYTLGSIAKHKNYQWITEVAKRNTDKQFVVAGNQDLKKWQIDSTGFELENIVYVGYVSDDENKALYENCIAYLHPAFYEGFGMPPLEAVSLGKDIAVSKIPEFLETYGDSVTYFDPNDYNFNLNSIKHIDDETRKNILSHYSWDETALLWYKLFSEGKE